MVNVLHLHWANTSVVLINDVLFVAWTTWQALCSVRQLNEGAANIKRNESLQADRQTSQFWWKLLDIDLRDFWKENFPPWLSSLKLWLVKPTTVCTVFFLAYYSFRGVVVACLTCKVALFLRMVGCKQIYDCATFSAFPNDGCFVFMGKFLARIGDLDRCFLYYDYTKHIHCTQVISI